MNRLILCPLLALALACGKTADNSNMAPEEKPPVAIEDATPPSSDVPDASADGSPPVEAPPVGIRDRAGRPLVVRVLASDANHAFYNSSEAPYPVEPTAKAMTSPQSIGQDFQDALVQLDALDAKDDWQGGAANAPADPDGIFPHPLVNAWLTDVIVVDPAMPFSPDGYLDIETNPGANLSCGGRWFADDAIDKTASFLINGTTSGVSDGVSAATKSPSLTFPYLASPN